MPVRLTIESNFVAQADKMALTIRRRLRVATSIALNDTAFSARDYVQHEMRSVFRDPEPFTLNSVLVQKANADVPLADMFAEVYIRYWPTKGGVAPEKWLLTEETGGARPQKRSERVLTAAGFLHQGRTWTPAQGMPLDSHGQPSGPGIVQILSHVKAFGESGFRANATDTTTQKIIRAARSKASRAARKAGASPAEARAAGQAAFAPIAKQTGTDFFVAKSHAGTGFIGIFQLVARGQVRPVMWFDQKAPTYTPRFPFRRWVALAAARTLPFTLRSAIERVTGTEK